MATRAGLLPDRYEDCTPIGRGGMGEIYRATDTALGRSVAVKVLAARYAQDEAVRERFTREALAVARLSGNSNIVTIYDVGEHDERPFIVMEYLAGGSLEQRMQKEGAQPPGRALEWLDQAATALDAAHRHGVVHRDVKPANLLFDRSGRVHVADFGIASAAGLDSLTQTGTVLGTASYLSPEQAKGELTSAASDLYSLGVVAFELLTGRRPFEADSVMAEAMAHVSADVPSVCALNPSLPCELDAVFDRALAKEPADRFGTAAEFVAALRGAFDDSAGTTRIVSAPPGRRALWPAALVGALLLAGGGIAAAVLTHGNDNAAPPPSTQRQSVSVKTVTQPGTTVVTTAPAPAPPPTTTAISESPSSLNDRAWSLMQQGDYAGALPLLRSALNELGGDTSLTAAYTNYNMGYTLIQLGQCADAIPYLERSRELQPSRREVKDALKAARRCS